MKYRNMILISYISMQHLLYKKTKQRPQQHNNIISNNRKFNDKINNKNNDSPCSQNAHLKFTTLKTQLHALLTSGYSLFPPLSSAPPSFHPSFFYSSTRRNIFFILFFIVTFMFYVIQLHKTTTLLTYHP